MTISVETVVIGALTGLTYAVLASGLVLVHRISRVINFAHGEIGAFGAALLAKLVLDLHWNWLGAFLVVVAMGAAIGAIIDLLVMRRLEDRPKLVLLVATIGLAQLLLVAQLMLPGVRTSASYPTAIGASVRIGNLLLRGEHLMVLILVPLIVLALGWFLNRSTVGTTIRASADNPDAARLAGVNVRAVSLIVWTIAGILSTVTIVLVNPIRGTIPGVASVALGPGLLLRALAAALVGRMTSLPRTLAGGVAIGVTEAIALVNTGDPGNVDAMMFGLVLLLVLLRREGPAREPVEAPALADQARRFVARNARGARYAAPAAALLVAVFLPFVAQSSARQFLFARVLVYALAALSVVVVTSWSGQLSLGQFAFVGLGALVTAGLVARGMSFPLAVTYATVVGALAATVIGIPALRVRGIFLGVTTLGFAVAARGWLLRDDVFLGDDTIAFVPRGKLGPLNLASMRTYYFVVLAVLVVVAAALARFRRTGAGRVVVAVRDNEAAASAFGIPPTVVKLSAFALAGAVAGCAGALWAGLHVQFDASAFGPEESLRVIGLAVIGGLGSVWGAILGAVFVFGLPALIHDSPAVQLLTSGAGLLVVLLYVPGGILQVLHTLRDRVFGATPAPPDEGAVQPPPRAVAPSATPGPALRVEGCTVAFGGIVAVDHVTLDVRSGETLGIIGTNGAGKSTLMNVIGGYVRADVGSISFEGTDITFDPPSARAGRGIGRVFQDARLFPGLTVAETFAVATETAERSELVPCLLGLPPARAAEARARAVVDDVVEMLNLRAYRDHPIATLSTGTRRVVELGCLIASSPRMLLLDEPTAGLAQREAEAFAGLIDGVKKQLGATVVLIEHDMPLVMALSDRIVCMADGRVIADGPPRVVREDPAVIAAYLGTTDVAVERSDLVGGRRG